jgi:FkbM family methyltransferase
MTLVGWIGRTVVGAARRSGFPLSATIRGRGPTSGIRMGLEGATRHHFAGLYEPSVQECIAERLRPGGCFIDVGANIGFFSLLAAKLAGPDGQVVAIEPVPANTDLIKANATLNRFGNVTVVRAAAGASNRTGELILARYHGGAALASAPKPPDARGRLSVPVVTLDGLVSHLGLPPPTMVKIDVEGAELEVLAGMPRTLWRDHPDILFEVDAPGMAEVEARFAKIGEALGHYGYAVRRLEAAYPPGDWAVLHGIGSTAETGAETGVQPGGGP